MQTAQLRRTFKLSGKDTNGTKARFAVTGSPDTQEKQEDEGSLFEIYKYTLHTMVMDLEAMGVSALPALLQMRIEFRDKRSELMRQSIAAEDSLRKADFKDDQSMSELIRLQDEQLYLYHQQGWLEGYIRDRQRDRQ